MIDRIDEIDRRLVAWIGDILDQVNVSLAPPAAAETARQVGLYLIELVQSQPARSTRRPPVTMTLRYLVTAQADKPEDSHQMLADLIVAAFQSTAFAVEQDPLPLSLWSSFGIAPRPAFVLRVPFKADLPEKRAPLVKKPMIIQHLPLVSFGGRILGPEDIPLMNVRVDLPSYELSTNTDSKGRFLFSAVPAVPGPKVLRVLAKGQEFSINTEQAGSEDDPLVIHLQLEG